MARFTFDGRAEKAMISFLFERGFLKKIYLAKVKELYYYCQAQGPTPGPTKVKVKVMVGTWSGHGQVRSGQTLTPNSNSNVGPELYTKIGFPPPLTTTPSLNECLVNFVTLCDTL